MAQLKFKVRHQYIERTDDFYVVAKSVDYLYAKFTCSEEWTGAITAQFKNDASRSTDPPYEVILDENNECQVPWEVLQYDNSKVSVTVFCGDLITANAAVVPVYKTAYSEDGESSHEPTPSVYAQIVDRLNKVENLEVEAETLPAGSEASVEKSVDPETGGYVFEFGIPKGDAGQDGYTPTISVTDITGGHRVIITNKTGSMTFDIMDGVDGVSPTVSVQNVTGGHRVTITDKTGDHVFDVMDGQDYILTEQDKADIAAMVVVPGVEFHICTSSEYDHTTRIPTIQNPETNIFYLVPAENGSAPDLFVEWIYANNAWEMFGSATIDLSAYATKVELAGKVDKVTGKGLSTNDYTTEEKNKLSGIEAQANKTVVDDALSSTSTNPVQNKKVKEALDNLDAGDIAYDDTETYSNGTVGKGLSSLKAEINQLSESIAPVESTTTATAAHAVGELFMVGETLMVALSAIAIGDTIITDGASPNAAVTTLSSKLLKDVQVNGTSVVTDGVANVPLATTNDYGVTREAITSDCKSGSTARMVSVRRQYASTFYGLAEAASDTTQSASSNPVGTYTDAAKIAIQKMLGIYEAPWELIREDTFTNATAESHIITVDGNGNAFELTDVVFMLETPVQTTQAIKANQGFAFYDGDTVKFSTYNGTWTQEANSTTTNACWTIIESKQGLVFATVRTKTATGSAGSLYQAYNKDFTGSLQHIIEDNNFKITKIITGNITGTAHYKLYGKRKWS